ncbi:TPA: lysozyme inhibitor [Pseudomonas aeruginosa]|nr:lysozyme inhibitor [Pseudomonas aeruginosa]
MKKALWLLLAAVPVVLVACGGSDDDKQTAQVDYLALPGDAKLDTRSVDYKCENGRKFTVQYLNKGDNSLAVVPVSDNSTLVFSNVISASGAKCAAGQYIWWTKGEEATLYGDWKGGEPTDGVACKER